MRYKDSKRASIFGIIGNIFLCIIKGICTFLFNSQAMRADLFNSAGDIFSLKSSKVFTPSSVIE